MRSREAIQEAKHRKSLTQSDYIGKKIKERNYKTFLKNRPNQFQVCFATSHKAGFTQGFNPRTPEHLNVNKRTAPRRFHSSVYKV